MEYDEIGNLISEKAKLNKLVLEKTQRAFSQFKEYSKDIAYKLNKTHPISNCRFERKGDFEFKLSFGSDTLVFMQHTNMFEFPRLHPVMKQSYIKEDEQRSYCGLINIYNFLSDSLDYNRDSDLGYLIGRIFVNKDNHYFIEGKREVGVIYTSFHNSILDNDAIENILVSSMKYVNSFDLLVPPFDEVKLTTLGEIITNQSTKKQITGKRLGFEFKQDND
ncbi:MAG: hypothetical protein LBM25_08060 [Bacteroidales bacterium]|jgi:hypothetical protein|nr:hypothetical protein [Bacteroidales bacterium]